MSLVAIQIFLSLVVELIFTRAMCMVLDMRSYPLYIALHLGCFCLSYYLSFSGTPQVVRILFINISTNFVLPIALSRGRLRSRLARMAAVNLGTLILEAVGDLLYIFVNPESRITEVSLAGGNNGAICLIYCALIPIAALAEEAVILVCRRAEDSTDTEVELPGILMMTLSFLSYIPLIIRADLTLDSRMGIYIVATTYAVVSLVASLALIAVAREDAKAARLAANRAAIARQERHVRGEVVASVRRTVGMSRLRHDLANQVEVVERLAAQGRYADADHYLELLQAQARELGGCA